MRSFVSVLALLVTLWLARAGGQSTTLKIAIIQSDGLSPTGAAVDSSFVQPIFIPADVSNAVQLQINQRTSVNSTNANISVTICCIIDSNTVQAVQAVATAQAAGVLAFSFEFPRIS